MNPYVIRFALANLALTLLAAILSEMLKLKSSGGLAIAVTMAACFFAAGRFAKDHGRAPTAEEKGAFAWRALLAGWVISLILVALFLAILVPAAEARSLMRMLASGQGLALGAGALLFVSAIYYVAIRWSFGWYARIASGKARQVSVRRRTP